MCDSELQLAFSKAIPIPVENGQEKEKVSKENNGALQAYPWRLMKLRRMVLGLLALLIAIAIAIGAGVGVRTRRFI